MGLLHLSSLWAHWPRPARARGACAALWEEPVSGRSQKRPHSLKNDPIPWFMYVAHLTHTHMVRPPPSAPAPPPPPPQDARIIQKLHRRVFLDKITREEATLYLSFYCEAANRDAFMAGAHALRATGSATRSRWLGGGRRWRAQEGQRGAWEEGRRKQGGGSGGGV